jgi:hypothetical protein
MKKRFNISVSYYVKNELKTVKKEVITTSHTQAWIAAAGMIPIHLGIDSAKIRVM